MPTITYHDSEVWVRRDNKAMLIDFITFFIDQPQIIEQLLPQIEKNLPNIPADTYMKLLQSHKVSKHMCTVYFNRYLSTNGINTPMYREFIRCYPELSQLVNETNIIKSSIYNMFRHIPLPDDIDTNKVMRDIDEFRYINALYPGMIQLTQHVALNAHIDVVRELLNPAHHGYMLAIWRLEGRICKVKDIVSLEWAYYVRKYDIEQWNNVNVNIFGTHLPFDVIDINNDLEVITDIFSRCDDYALQSLLIRLYDEVKCSVMRHWLTALLAAYRIYHNETPTTITLDGCNACKYLLSKIESK